MSKVLDIFEFGQGLIDSRDLDPVYVILWEAQLDKDELERWLVAYWCFYHMGTASWIAENSKDFWDRLRTAAGSKAYPRCPERRHFRGQNAINSVDYIQSKGLHQLWYPLYKGGDCEMIMGRVQQWVGFGPWISFKVADMLDRLELARVTFDTDTVYLFDSPKRAAEALREELEPSTPDESLESWAVETVLGGVSGKAPPRYERPLGPQEAETILCKWKSHRNGKYTVGEDIIHCKKGLYKFLGSRMSQRLIKAAKRVDLW